MKSPERRWYYGPNGEAQIFAKDAEVPDDWRKSPADFRNPEPPQIVSEVVQVISAPEPAPAPELPVAEPVAAPPARRRGGRPKGSKNK